MSKISETPIPSMSARIGKLQKELEWYKAYVDNVKSAEDDAHGYACEHANNTVGESDEYPYGYDKYPYEEGDDYWTIEKLQRDYDDNTGCFNHGIRAVQSCWDDQSEEMHYEKKKYFDSLDDVLQYARHQYDFIQVECYDSGMSDIKTGDYFVTTDEDWGKFQKSY